MGVEELLGGTILSSMVGSKGVPCPTADPPSPVIVAEQFLESNWNLFASMDQHVDFIVSTAPSSYTPGMQEHPGISRSNGCPMEQIPGFKFFDNGKIMCPFGLPEDGDQVTSSLLPTESLPSEEQDNEKDSRGKKRRRMLESGALGSLSQFCGIQTAEAEHKKDVKKEKGGKIPGTIAHKLASEQVKGSSSSGDDPKEDYVHVRAKRGQATNSHSLAERVRREKISQRMKFLQDLVPGCNKITGKAVMLDEIINYVQSLQQQVEFLSMKLATVNPEMHFEIEQALSTGVLYSQTGNPGLPVIGTGFNASHFHFQRPIGEGVMQAQTSSNVWDDDLQNVTQMDFVSNAHIDAAAAKSPASVKMKQ